MIKSSVVSKATYCFRAFIQLICSWFKCIPLVACVHLEKLFARTRANLSTLRMQNSDPFC